MQRPLGASSSRLNGQGPPEMQCLLIHPAEEDHGSTLGGTSFSSSPFTLSPPSPLYVLTFFVISSTLFNLSGPSSDIHSLSTAARIQTVSPTPRPTPIVLPPRHISTSCAHRLTTHTYFNDCAAVLEIACLVPRGLTPLYSKKKSAGLDWAGQQTAALSARLEQAT